MWILLSGLFVLGFFHTACNISLLLKKKHKLMYSAAIFLGIFSLFPWSKALNIQDVDQFLSKLETLSTACTFQVIEALLMMFISVLLIRSHYQINTDGWKQKVAKYVALFPSGIFLIGLFILQTYAFNVVEEIPFYLIALGLAVAGFCILIATQFLIVMLLGTWEASVEIKIVLAFLQALLAMFLPIIITGNKLTESHFVFEPRQAVLTIISLVMISLVGFMWHKRRAKRLRL